MSYGRILTALRIKQGVHVLLYRLLKKSTTEEWYCKSFCPACEYAGICYHSMLVELGKDPEEIK